MGNGPVQAGQTNPHLPGFNPSSVPYINTPVGGAPGVTGSLGGARTPGAGPTGGASPQQLSLLAQLFQGGGAGAPAAAAGGGGVSGGGGVGGDVGFDAGEFWWRSRRHGKPRWCRHAWCWANGGR
jgi:hypothetical protein